MLDDVNVALGVTGSIAAVRCVELIHELQRWGANVRVVMSPAATSIVDPWALEFASGASVVTEITGGVEHIELCGTDGWADVLAIAPATANTVGKVATAIDDTPVTTTATTAIGAGIDLVVAPAMHAPMYEHPTVTDHLETLADRHGAVIAPPRREEDKAKIATNSAICLAIARAVGSRPLDGRHVVVSSGPTAEPIDPVRHITSPASGRTGRAVAQGLYALGADVTLLQAADAEVSYATVEAIETSADLRAAALEVAPTADAYVSASAVSDFTVEAAAEKLPSGDPVTLELRPTPKVIDAVREADDSLPIVGFKVETSASDEALVDAARDLLERVDLTFVVANRAEVMGEPDTRVLLVDAEMVETIAGSKRQVGWSIARRLADRLGGHDGTK